MAFPITRQEAIWRQLDTAIDLWFRGCDPISIHTLACASLQVARDVGKIYGKQGMLIDNLPKNLREKALDIQNFFKHADRSPHRVLNFNPDVTEGHIYDALSLYGELYRGLTPLMTAFRIRFLITNPNIGTITLPESLTHKFGERALAEMSDRDFYDAVMPILCRP